MQYNPSNALKWPIVFLNSQGFNSLKNLFSKVILKINMPSKGDLLMGTFTLKGGGQPCFFLNSKLTNFKVSKSKIFQGGHQQDERFSPSQILEPSTPLSKTFSLFFDLTSEALNV